MIDAYDKRKRGTNTPKDALDLCSLLYGGFLLLRLCSSLPDLVKP